MDVAKTIELLAVYGFMAESRYKMTEQWRELKETIIEMRDNNGTATQQEVCKFLANLMDVLEKQTNCSEFPNSSDTISRQEAIDIVRYECCELKGLAKRIVEKFNGLPPVQPYTEAEIQKMQELEQAELEKAFKLGKEEANKWIPCSEKLPEPRIDVWCNSDIGQIQGYYEEHVGTWYASFGLGRDYLELIVNAWMPLPESYKPQESEK